MQPSTAVGRLTTSKQCLIASWLCVAHSNSLSGPRRGGLQSVTHLVAAEIPCRLGQGLQVQTMTAGNPRELGLHLEVHLQTCSGAYSGELQVACSLGSWKLTPAGREFARWLSD